MTTRPEIQSGDWLRVRNGSFVVIAGALRRMGRGWQVWIDEPIINDDGADEPSCYLDTGYRWINVRDVVEVRKSSSPSPRKAAKK